MHFFLRYKPRHGVAGLKNKSIFKILKICSSVIRWLHHFTSLLINRWIFITHLLSKACCHHRLKLGLEFYFFNGWWCWVYSFAYWSLCIILGEINLYSDSLHILIWLFLLLICHSSKYVLNTILWSYMLFEKNFCGLSWWDTWVILYDVWISWNMFPVHLFYIFIEKRLHGEVSMRNAPC